MKIIDIYHRYLSPNYSVTYWLRQASFRRLFFAHGLRGFCERRFRFQNHCIEKPLSSGAAFFNE
jgi:hypothetical protein